MQDYNTCVAVLTFAFSFATIITIKNRNWGSGGYFIPQNIKSPYGAGGITMKPITIALPKVIPVLRDGMDQRIKTNVQEFNMYFENIILPYRQEYDVQVRCQYGRNFGRFWRLSEYPKDVDSFDFELVIYDEYDSKLTNWKMIQLNTSTSRSNIELFITDIIDIACYE